MASPAPRRKPPAGTLLRASSALSPAERAHLAVRLLSAPWDRVVGAVEAGAGPLLDVGCGPGLLAWLLGTDGFRDRYLGVDPDPRKVARARAWLGESETRGFRAARVEEVAEGGFGRVAIVDVLYLVPRGARAGLVAAAAARLAPGGRLVVLTSGGGPAWKRAVDRLQERLAVLLGVTRGDVVDPCDGREVGALLSGAGLEDVRVEDAGAGYAHGFELVSGRKPATPPAA